MTTLYGISNCDTIRKAKKWLDAQGIDYQYHDFRKNGLERELLKSWVDELGWEILINKRGTTWRQLPDETKSRIDESSAIEVMLESPAIIKRPVLDLGERRVVGFKEADYQELFS